MEGFLAMALLMGLTSSLHCIGMCGAISGALSLGLPETVRARRGLLLAYNLLFSLGRIFSYALAGLLTGTVGSALAESLDSAPALVLPRLIAALTVIAAGLHLGGWVPRLALVEGLGVPLWRRLEPVGRSLIPIRSPFQALLYGTVWGWLPCGLVYWALLISATAPNATQGMLFMLVFGVTTVPAMLATGMLAGWIRQLRAWRHARSIAGALLILMGLVALWYTLALGLLRQS